MNNANAYLITLPQGVGQSRQEFQALFNGAEHKTQLMPNVYLVHSTKDLSAWYRAVGTEGTTSATASGTIGVTTPVILPLDVDQFKGVQGVPDSLMTFINQYTRAA